MSMIWPPLYIYTVYGMVLKLVCMVSMVPSFILIFDHDTIHTTRVILYLLLLYRPTTVKKSVGYQNYLFVYFSYFHITFFFKYIHIFETRMPSFTILCQIKSNDIDEFINVLAYYMIET